MSFRFYFFFLFFSFFALFYPGEQKYYQIIAFDRSIFYQHTDLPSLQLQSIPVINTPEGPFITAQGVYIVDLETYTPVYKKNSQKKLYPASTTKIITALVSRDVYEPEQIISVQIATTEGQLMELVPGERITAENLLYGALVLSGNDAAFALAAEYGQEDFVNLMNEKAQELGMYNSHFENPAGFDEQDQLTTPEDLALAARAVLEDDYLRKIVGTKQIVISDVDYTVFHNLVNVNQLLGEIPGLGGLKTGYTELAGENLVSYYQHQGHEYIIVVMKSEDRFQDTRNIVDWIQRNVSYITPEI